MNHFAQTLRETIPFEQRKHSRMMACHEVKRLCDEIIEAVQHGECIDTFKWSLIERKRLRVVA